MLYEAGSHDPAHLVVFMVSYMALRIPCNALLKLWRSGDLETWGVHIRQFNFAHALHLAFPSIPASTPAMSRLSITSRIKLNDGHAIPRFGLGVYESSPGPETYDAVLAALNAGYRQIDGAEWYENEADCGRAIVDFMASSGVAREEIWFTTKLMHNRGREHVITAVKESLRLCGTSIDLYLVHDPSGGEDVRLESWLGCCDAKDQGLVKSIGVR